VSNEIAVREASAEDWPGIWRALEPAFRAGETYTYPRDIGEAEARAAWTALPGARVLVAVAADPSRDEETILGTAKYLPNHPGAGSHVANASFVVGPEGTERGVGRALAAAVVETNERAVRLWESFGFEILTTVPEAFSHPVHGLVGLHIMYRDL